MTRQTQDTLIVYTVIIGDGYTPPPVEFPEENVEYVLFTDQVDLKTEGWQVEQVTPLVLGDLPRSSRDPKIRPHRHFKSHQRSLYLDSSVRLIGPASEFWEYLIPREEIVFGGFFHSFRDSIRDEFVAVSEAKLERSEVLREMEATLRATSPDVMSLKPVYGGLLARRHHDPRLVDVMERWFAMVLRYSRRDQLSLPGLLRLLPPERVNLLSEDIRRSEYHQWPRQGSVRPTRYREGYIQDTSLSLKKPPQLVRHLRRGRRKKTRSREKGIWTSIERWMRTRGKGAYDPEHRLFFTTTEDGRRVYVSHQKRLALYKQGMEERIHYLLRDYQIPTDLIRRDDTVVDIGANSGELGLWSASRHARYIAFEPDPEAFRALSLNNPAGTLFPIAVGDKESVQPFYLATSHADSSLFQGNDVTKSIAIEVKTLDSIVEEVGIVGNIRLLKVEAEGTEPEVLQGAIKTLRKVEYVAVDAGPERGGVDTIAPVLNLLMSRNFEIIDCYPLRGTFLLRNLSTS